MNPKTLSTSETDDIARRWDVADKEAPGPWRVGTHDRDAIFIPHPEGIGGLAGERVLLRMNEHFPFYGVVQFIAHAWLDVRRLVVSLRRERARVGELDDRLREIESAVRGGCTCVDGGKMGDGREWHVGDCPVARFIGREGR